ncbi:MAG: hypothetical protein JWP29_3544 [Rhodoferax sp.]|nr:hypothetical protein [Rhodoferax sp.]
MANIDRIVNVTIALRTTAIAQQSFSDMMVFGPHVLDLARVMVVTSPDDLLDLGMDENDPMYLAVRDAFSQTPCVRQVFIGRQSVDDVTLNVPGSVNAGDTFSMLMGYNVNGSATTAAVSFTATVAGASGVVTGLIAAMGNAGVPFTGTNVSGSLKIAPNTSGAAFSVKPVTTNLTLGAKTVTETATIALAACKSANNGWYGLVVPDRTQATVLAVAAWAEAAKKLFVTSVADINAANSGSITDTGYLLKNGQFFRTAWWYHPLAVSDFPEAAIMSKSFTKYPGQETWANQELAAINADVLAEGTALNVFNKNGNTFESFRNVAITQNGRVAGGEWIDVIRFRDWLEEEIKVRVFGLMVDNRIPYDDVGIRMVGAMVRGALDQGVARGGIAPEELDSSNRIIRSYTLSLPLSADVSFNDKANRVLNDISFTARLAGAIHAANISGTLSYSLS